MMPSVHRARTTASRQACAAESGDALVVERVLALRERVLVNPQPDVLEVCHVHHLRICQYGR